MKIINIVPALTSEASGPSYSVTKLCSFLISLKIDVVLIALDWNGQQSNFNFVRLFKISFGPKKLGRSISMYRWMNNLSSTNQVDLIHNHGMWQMNSVYPGSICYRYNIPYIVSPRGSWSKWAMNNGSIFKDIFWRFIQKPSFKAVTCFHATAFSEYLDIRRMGFKQPVAIIPNGINIPEYKKNNNSDNRTLLFLGRIHPVKGLDILLNSWKQIHPFFPNWKLLIVGSDSGFHSSSGYLKSMKRLSIKLNLKNIEFCGPKFGPEKWKVFSESDLYVLPTHSENFGISVAESLASGTPCIVTKGAPWSELEKYSAGKWIDHGVQPLVDSLHELMSKDINDLNLMGLRGRKWMEEEYSWEKVSTQMKEVYEWVTNKNQKTPDFIKLD